MAWWSIPLVMEILFLQSTSHRRTFPATHTYPGPVATAVTRLTMQRPVLVKHHRYTQSVFPKARRTVSPGHGIFDDGGVGVGAGGWMRGGFFYGVLLLAILRWREVTCVTLSG